MNLNNTQVSSPRQPEGALPSEPLPTAEDWARLEALELLRVMGERWSYARVGTWIRSLAAMAGQDMERSADRCLADGAALINLVCVQCGRDNS